MPSANSSEFLARLQRHPELQAKFDALLDIVDNASGDALKADEAEQLVFEELRRMGQQALQSWANRKQQRVEADSDARSDLARKEKKASLADSLRADKDSGADL
jgi:transcriptional regulator GlxA family with amidase domain